MPDSTATTRFTCAIPTCTWTRETGREDHAAGLTAFEEFDAHEAAEHPEGAHMQIETTYAR